MENQNMPLKLERLKEVTGAADESWRTKRGKAANQILWLSYSFSQLFKIVQTVYIHTPQSLNLSRAMGTHCPRYCQETVRMPDEMMQGNNAFRRQDKEMERKEFKEGRINEVEEEEKRVIWWKILCLG